MELFVLRGSVEESILARRNEWSLQEVETENAELKSVLDSKQTVSWCNWPVCVIPLLANSLHACIMGFMHAGTTAIIGRTCVQASEQLYRHSSMHATALHSCRRACEFCMQAHASRGRFAPSCRKARAAASSQNQPSEFVHCIRVHVPIACDNPMHLINPLHTACMRRYSFACGIQDLKAPSSLRSSASAFASRASSPVGFGGPAPNTQRSSRRKAGWLTSRDYLRGPQAAAAAGEIPETSDALAASAKAGRKKRRKPGRLIFIFKCSI